MNYNILLMVVIVLLSSCGGLIQNKAVQGLNLPAFSGKSLKNKTVKFPSNLEKENTILIVGYKQRSQFDIDRWLIGLEMAKVKIPVYEIPVLSPWFPKFLQKRIDRGMQSGIPQNLWTNVITVYKDANKIKDFLGNEKPNNARVLLVNKKGKIIRFTDQGFSVSELKSFLNILPKSSKSNCW